MCSCREHYCLKQRPLNYSGLGRGSRLLDRVRQGPLAPWCPGRSIVGFGCSSSPRSPRAVDWSHPRPLCTHPDPAPWQLTSGARRASSFPLLTPGPKHRVWHFQSRSLSFLWLPTAPLLFRPPQSSRPRGLLHRRDRHPPSVRCRRPLSQGSRLRSASSARYHRSHPRLDGLACAPARCYCPSQTC